MKAKIGQRVDFILNACRNKRVLHVGCSDTPYTKLRLADGTLLHSQIDKVAKIQYGIDIDPDGIESLRQAGFNNLAVGNVESILQERPFGEDEFDVIVAGEIIEHVSNPGLFLDGLRPLLSSPSTKLVLTTINAMCAYRILYTMLTGRECVHPDHVYYFSRSTLCKLLENHGYEIEEFAYYPIGEEHKKHMLRGARLALWIADRIAYRFAPALGDGVMVMCRRKVQES